MERRQQRQQLQLKPLQPLLKVKFQTGELQAIGLTFVSVTYHVLVSLPKLQRMATARVFWLIISKKAIMMKFTLMT